MLTIINPWAVLIAAVAAYLAGWAWYSPVLWRKPWRESRGKTANNAKEGMKETPKVIAYGFINTLAISFVISVFLVLTGVTTLLEALQVALLLCFGFVVTVKFNDLLYTNTPPHWGKRAQLGFLIDAGYQIVLFVVVATIVWFLSR